MLLQCGTLCTYVWFNLIEIPFRAQRSTSQQMELSGMSKADNSKCILTGITLAKFRRGVGKARQVGIPSRHLALQ